MGDLEQRVRQRQPRHQRSDPQHPGLQRAAGTEEPVSHRPRRLAGQLKAGGARHHDLQWQDTAINPQFPSLDSINSGYRATFYIVSTGADWTLSPTLVSQLSFGVQSNHEEFQPLNSTDIYAASGARRIPFPLTLTSPQPTTDLLPLPRNNPVWNVSDTFTWLKSSHTVTFGGTFRYTTMWESIWGNAAGGPAWNHRHQRGGPGVGGLHGDDAARHPQHRSGDGAIAVCVSDRPRQQHFRASTTSTRCPRPTDRTR